jgi:hypothetical protein
VEHYRETGERLTNLEWKFYHYGPYAFELEKILDGPEFQVRKVQNDDEIEFIGYAIKEPEYDYHSQFTDIGKIKRDPTEDW